jgi:hypothetical protein
MKVRLSKSLFILFLVMIVDGLPCLAQGLGGRHFEKEGGFSYQPPTGWKITELPGMKFKGVFGPPVDGFSPNINFVGEAASDSLQDYVEGTLKALQSAFRGFEKLNQTTFKTDVGQTGIKLITQGELGRKMLRQTYYIFEVSKGRKLVVTCSALAKGGEIFDKVFDESLKTLILGNS